MLDEGLDAAIARHAECGRLLQDGLETLGFELFAAEGHRLPELTTVWVPEGLDDAKAQGDACSTATASRSAAGSASSPGRCGASAAWATPPGRATSRSCSARSAELLAGR